MKKNPYMIASGVLFFLAFVYSVANLAIAKMPFVFLGTKSPTYVLLGVLFTGFISGVLFALGFRKRGGDSDMPSDF